MLEHDLIIIIIMKYNYYCTIMKIIIIIIVKCAMRAHCEVKDDGIVLQPDVPVP